MWRWSDVGRGRASVGGGGARAWSQSKSTASPPKGSESITAVSFIPRRTRQTTKKTGIVITELKPISAYLQ